MRKRKFDGDLLDQIQTDRVPVVFHYDDHRSYLLDFFSFRKKENPKYSYRVFARKAGLASPSLLKMVTEGKRNIGPRAIHKFVKGIGLLGLEAEYFICLVEIAQQKDSEVRDHFLKRKQSLKMFSLRREITESGKKYLTHWLYPVIREMTALEGFVPEPSFIGNRLLGEASHEEIRQVLSDLLSLGMVGRDEKNRLVPTQGVLFTKGELSFDDLLNYHRLFLKLTAEVMHLPDKNLVEFRSITIAVPENEIEEVRKKIQKCKEEILQDILARRKQSGPDTVLQLNIQMFPVSKKC